MNQLPQIRALPECAAHPRFNVGIRWIGIFLHRNEAGPHWLEAVEPLGVAEFELIAGHRLALQITSRHVVCQGQTGNCCQRVFFRNVATARTDDRRDFARILIGDYLRYCAERPQLARFMIQEGGVLTPRLTWLFERHTGELIRGMQNLISAARFNWPTS